MAHVEILNFGTLPSSPGAEPGVLSRSAGFQQDLVDEVTRLCKGWGQPLLAEEIRPALLSFPLKVRPKFASKGAYAIIKVQGNPRLVFQVAVINGSDYGIYGFNPFTLVEVGAFPDWDPAAVPGRRILQPPTGPLVISPPPSPEDVGLVDEALHQILMVHKLYLPIEKATAQSDRCLALLVEVLPEAFKRQMRFASYAPSSANGYHLAATATVDCEFSGWQRMMMTLVGGVLPENQGQYVKKVRDCLAFGDIGVIRNDGKRLCLDPTQEPSVPASRRMEGLSVPSTPRPKTNNKIMAASLPGADRPVQGNRRVTRKNRRIPDNAGGRSPQLAQLRGKNRQLPGPVVAFLIMIVTLGSGWVYLQYFQGEEGISWTELVSWPGMKENKSGNRVNSLLEVANVGAVYDQQLKKIKRAKIIPGLDPEAEQLKALVHLKNEAAEPLLGQVDLFVKLAAAGIRQGERPDRESDRLASLAGQGHVLAIEMARLGLSWHSLSSGKNWPDLAGLKDTVVLARRDSLKEAKEATLTAAALGLGFGNRQKDLQRALVQVKGMSRLLVLFQETQWSPQWETDLLNAAERVSPAASSMTRAYRNCAFTMVRLKHAEHQVDYAASAFVPRLEKGCWPTAAVADILPGLRREILKFNHKETPPLLLETMSLYKILENPEPIIKELATGQRTLASLRDNPAFDFDAAIYGDFLERIRYQAAEECAQLGNDCLDLAGDPDSPFRQRWARNSAQREKEADLRALAKFETAWNEVEIQIRQLKALSSRGKDWTAAWVDLDGALEAGLELGTPLAARQNKVAGRVLDLQILRQALGGARPLELEQVTVRLDQGRLTAPQQVVFEFQTLPDGPVVRSEPFTVGPAAPAGSGWVGTVTVSVQPLLSPLQSFRGGLRLVDGGRELMRVDYPSLQERVGPGALARQRTGVGGSLRIRIADRWWRGLHLTSLSSTSGPS